MKKVEQNQKATGEARKPYEAPQLTIYGTINQITEATTNGKFADGGTGMLSMGSG